MPEIDVAELNTQLAEINDKINGFEGHITEARALAEKAPHAADVDERFQAIGADVAELRKGAAGLQALIAEREAEIEELAARYDQVTSRLEEQALLIASGETQRGEQFKAFCSYVREGRDRAESLAYQWAQREDFKDQEQRALSEGVQVEGGFLVEPAIERAIIKDVVTINPIMSVARVMAIDAPELKVKHRTSGPTFYWVGESGEPTKSAAAYETITIPAWQGGVETVVSTPLLQDVNYIEQEMTEDAAEAIAAGLGDAFLEGTGAGKPEGIMLNSDIDEVSGGDTSTYLVEGDDFYSLLFGNGDDGTGLRARYRTNAVFAFNSTVLGKVMKLKASTSGVYIWQAGLREGAPDRVAGKPYIVCDGMDTDGNTANEPVLVADWRRAYRIARRKGVWILRDPYTAKPDVEFTWYVRYGGKTVQPEAAKKLVFN